MKLIYYFELRFTEKIVDIVHFQMEAEAIEVVFINAHMFHFIYPSTAFSFLWIICAFHHYSVQFNALENTAIAVLLVQKVKVIEVQFIVGSSQSFSLISFIFLVFDPHHYLSFLNYLLIDHIVASWVRIVLFIYQFSLLPVIIDHLFQYLVESFPLVLVIADFTNSSRLHSSEESGSESVLF